MKTDIWSPGQPPWIIAHRGAMRRAPENSRSAFDKALSCPIQGLEFDVQLSLDHVPVIYHHRTLFQINKGRKRIADFTYPQLRRMDWGGWFSKQYREERILTLSQMLTLYCEKTALMIELKSRRQDRLSERYRVLARKTLTLIQQQVPENRLKHVFLLSFDPKLLAYAYGISSRMNYVLSLDKAALLGKNRCHPDLPDTAFYGVCISIGKLTRKFAEGMAARGLQVMTYGCNAPAQVGKALKSEIPVVMTDKPCWLSNYLKEVGKRNSNS